MDELNDHSDEYYEGLKAFWPKKKRNKKMEKKQVKKEDNISTVDVLIIISGGAVQEVLKAENTTVEIHDYDIENSDQPENRPDCEQDEKGDWYQRMFWDKGNWGTA
jgi:hypothetical protein